MPNHEVERMPFAYRNEPLGFAISLTFSQETFTLHISGFARLGDDRVLPGLFIFPGEIGQSSRFLVVVVFSSRRWRSCL